MTTGEIATLVTDATPYLTAALAAYGGAVLTKVRDAWHQIATRPQQAVS